MTTITMSVSPDGGQMVIVPFLSSNIFFAGSTTFVSASSCEHIKEDIRVNSASNYMFKVNNK